MKITINQIYNHDVLGPVRVVRFLPNEEVYEVKRLMVVEAFNRKLRVGELKEFVR